MGVKKLWTEGGGAPLLHKKYNAKIAVMLDMARGYRYNV